MRTGPLLRAGVRFHLRRPLELALAIAGVALGVAVVAAMDLAIESARRGFDLSSEAVFGRTTHVLRGGPAGVDEALYVALRTHAAEFAAAPVVEGRVQVDGAAPRTLTLLGIDPFAEAPFRAHSPAPGRGSGIALAEMVTRPGAVLASPGTAARLGAAPGDALAARVAGRAVSLTLVGMLAPANELERAGLDDVLIADVATAQEALGRTGRVDRIELILPDGPERAAALARVRALLPPAVRVERGAASADANREMTRAFYLNLRMLSLLALVVGMFVVYNAMTFAVVRRRALIGTLRAVGVTGREILVTVLAEAALLGAAGTALGLPLGAALASELVRLVTRTVDDLYFATTVRALTLVPGATVAPLLLGVGGAVLAALLPALEATRIPARAALTRSHLETGALRAVPRAAGAGVCLALAGVALLSGGERSLAAAFGALFCLVAAFAAWTPGATLALARALECVARVPGGALAAMSMRGVRASLSRSAVAVAALMIALATTVGVAVMVDSFRESLRAWLSTTLAADVYVAVPGRGAGASLPPALVERAPTLAGVEAVSISRDAEIGSEHGDVWLKAVNASGARYRGLAMVAGDADAAWRAIASADAVLASEPFAWRHGLRPGSGVTLHTTRGPRRFRVRGVFRDYGSDRGMLMMGLSTYRAHFDDPNVSGLGLHLAPGADAAELGDALAALAGPGQRLQVRAQGWIRDASLRIFDRTFAITRVLQWLATLVACVGVLSALMALALERAREMAVLRAQGLTRRELFAMMQAQTASMGLIAGLLSLPLGTLMAVVLVHVINRRAFGWGLDLHVAPEILAHTLAIALLASLAAGVYPAWRMASTPAALALRDA